MHTTAIHKKVSTDKESYVGKKNIIRNNDAVNNKGRIKAFLKYSSKGIFINGNTIQNLIHWTNVSIIPYIIITESGDIPNILRPT